jgi:orotidine-5'-phosphate decarboxylase
MMRAAAEAGHAAAGALGVPPPLVIGVTVLTSMSAETLRATGVDRPLDEQVLALACAARDAGLDGVVASPRETPALRAACGTSFTIVTPGIRGASAGSEQDDQVRAMGPAEAIRAGASYLVVGRPIIRAADPRAAAEAIAAEAAAARA